MQSPEFFLKDLGIGVNCVVETERPARMDPEHRVFVNWETYYLADDEALARFRADPVRYVGTVTDPVSRRRFAPDVHSPRVDHEDRIVYFASDENAERFRSSPEAFATPMIGMSEPAK